MNAAVTDGEDEGEVARRFRREADLLRPLGPDGT